MAGGDKSDGGRAAGRKRSLRGYGGKLQKGATFSLSASIEARRAEEHCAEGHGDAPATSSQSEVDAAILGCPNGKKPVKAELLNLVTGEHGPGSSDPPGDVRYGEKRARAEALVDFLGLSNASDYGVALSVGGNNPGFLQKFLGDKGTSAVHGVFGARVELLATAAFDKGQVHSDFRETPELLTTTAIDKVQGEVQATTELLVAGNFEHARAVFENWLRTSQNASDATVERALRCTIGQELRRMPRPTGVRFPKKGATGKNYRHLFYKQVARILGWVEKRGEGSERGFSDELYKVVREILYPDNISDDETSRATDGKESASGSRGGGTREA